MANGFMSKPGSPQWISIRDCPVFNAEPLLNQVWRLNVDAHDRAENLDNTFRYGSAIGWPPTSLAVPSIPVMSVAALVSHKAQPVLGSEANQYCEPASAGTGMSTPSSGHCETSVPPEVQIMVSEDCSLSPLFLRRVSSVQPSQGVSRLLESHASAHGGGSAAGEGPNAIAPQHQPLSPNNSSCPPGSETVYAAMPWVDPAQKPIGPSPRILVSVVPCIVPGYMIVPHGEHQNFGIGYSQMNEPNCLVDLRQFAYSTLAAPLNKR
ncbi:hypothetical protein AURDEDRAFT_126040 [Auricularia subglabra TFB-10046 SS5]|nr:hypothetical protein AURDEDRAFT_126040 [Auricularia subglabra TFB-10046 SS5]